MGLTLEGGQSSEVAINFHRDDRWRVARDLFVVGHATISVGLKNGAVLVVEGGQTEVRFNSGGVSLSLPDGEVWPVAVNYGAVMDAQEALRQGRNPELARMLLDSTLSPMLPEALLNPETAPSVPAGVVFDSTITLISVVERMQMALGWAIREGLRGTLNLRDVSWRPPLRPQTGFGQLGEYGHIYQVFRENNLRLDLLRGEIVTLATAQEALKMIPREVLDRVLASFGPA